MNTKVAIYTKEEQRLLGAFYTPLILADLIARLLEPLCSVSKDTSVCVMDPAMGDGALLQSFAQVAQKRKRIYNLVGIDIDNRAIERSTRIFEKDKDKCAFVNTDAIYPLESSIPADGWKDLSKMYFPAGIDIIVSNPPWGASLDKYSNLTKDFETATGQFDIYDLFIETIVTNLKEGGVYGIILPDSIFNQEHTLSRKILLSQTAIKGIIRLGEGFFHDVNTAVSIIYGIKKPNPTSKALCAHVSNDDKKAILSGDLDVYRLIKEKSTKITNRQMILSNYSFIVDISSEDMPLLTKLESNDALGNYVFCQRGVELSKNGYVLQCAHCKQHFPKPKEKLGHVQCPHCKKTMPITNAIQTCIISSKQKEGCLPLIVGEDIGRYAVSASRYIKTKVQGINYKSMSIYESPKVLVRKTGVGISAGIDYQNCLVNQVVYLMKPKEEVSTLITAELICSILCSRLITYVIIKKKGSIGWTSNPYLSQTDVKMLPFPKLDYNDERTISALKRITELVRENVQRNDCLSLAVDAEIEYLIAYLYHMSIEDYRIIMDSISQVEQMIPFKRLLNVKLSDIFSNGI